MEKYNKILEWLNTHGYQLEMKVSKKLHEAGFWVQNSYYYNDPDTNTFREIDVVSKYREETGMLNINFVCECKSSVDKPFIVFTSNNTLDLRNKFMSFSYNSNSAKKMLLDNKNKFEEIPWINKEQRVGYNFVQSFKNSQTDTYQAVMAVLKASKFIYNEYETMRLNAFNFVFPIIIVEGNLFECYLNKKNEMCLNEISQCFLFNDIKICNDFPPCINVININYMDEFIKEANKLTNVIYMLCKDRLYEMLKKVGRP